MKLNFLDEIQISKNPKFFKPKLRIGYKLCLSISNNLIKKNICWCKLKNTDKKINRTNTDVCSACKSKQPVSFHFIKLNHFQVEGGWPVFYLHI